MIRKGFTLVELLVVMAVVAVLAAGLIVGVDPVQKIRQAQDVRAKDAVVAVANAMRAYAAGDPGGLYPADLTELQTEYKGTVPTYLTVAYSTTVPVITASIQSTKYCSTLNGCTWRWDTTLGSVTCVNGSGTCTAAASL